MRKQIYRRILSLDSFTAKFIIRLSLIWVLLNTVKKLWRNRYGNLSCNAPASRLCKNDLDRLSSVRGYFDNKCPLTHDLHILGVPFTINGCIMDLAFWQLTEAPVSGVGIVCHIFSERNLETCASLLD